MTNMLFFISVSKGYYIFFFFLLKGNNLKIYDFLRCFAKFRLFCRNRDFSLCIVLSFLALFFSHWTSLVAQLVRNPPAMQETWVQTLGWENPLEKGTATHSSIPDWEFHGLYIVHGAAELDTAVWLSLSLS